MKILPVNLSAQYESIKKEIDEAAFRVLNSGQYILGSEVEAFEEELAKYVETKFAIGVSSGTDALLLILRALDIGEGDEVITTPFSFMATAEVIALLGAKPVFVDLDPKTFNIDMTKIEEVITEKTKAILPVHLYGQSADMDPILEIAKRYGLKVIEDSAQAIGARYKGKKVCSFGVAAGISFFPTKNLGCCGDGGMVTTNHEEVARKIRLLRTHGEKEKYHYQFLGYNKRLDALQAAIIRVKLSHLEDWNERRRWIAKRYDELIGEVVQIPYVESYNLHVYHQYTIRTKKREELRRYLKEKGIFSLVYYPLPLHLQPALSYLGYKKGDLPQSEILAEEVLSLPIYPEMREEEVEYVGEAVVNFFK